MSERIISTADLSYIERNLNAISNGIDTLDSDVGTVNNNVKVVYDEVGNLAREFHDFISVQMRANRSNQAETRLVKIRQELDKKYGHYDIVRRATTGILQADDLGIVKKDTISNTTEEIMITTPGYWLAPCLVALSAWINDQPELADKAMMEGISRNDEKTSLFFALVCRRAGRKDACLKWAQRFLANQDEENLNRETIIILDAYASGILGVDSEGVISKQISEWISHLEEKPGFIDKQTQQWSDAINLKRKPIDTSSYTYLRKYSKTWPILEDVLEGACLNEEMLDYLVGIFEQKSSTASVKEQLDQILNSLVQNYDDEELPLRKEERFEQLVVDFGGDENRAKSNMTIEQQTFEEKKDFTQLLTDAAMNPESSHANVSTQKFALALSKDWMQNAYKDVVATNRMKVPNEIEINVDTFNDKTTDGQNEKELISNFESLVEKEKTDALAQTVLSIFDTASLYGGMAIAVIGLITMVAGSTFMGLIAIFGGIMLIINHFSKKKQIEQNRENIIKKFDEKKKNGTQVIRATLAEVVDFREEFADKDSIDEEVLSFIDQMKPNQYIQKVAESNRKVMV